MSRAGALVEALFWAFVLWLYGGDVVLLARVAAAPVAAIDLLPSLPIALLGTALGVAGAALMGLRLRGRLQADARPQRLVRGVGALLVLVDLLLLSSGSVVLGGERQQLLAVAEFAREAQGRSTAEAVLTDRAALESVAAGLGPPPLFLSGEPAAAWRLQVRQECAGPTAELAGAAPGTIVYCVAPDARRAWVWLVSLPRGERFGSPAVFGLDGAALGELSANAPQSPAPDLDEGAVWAPPTPSGE